MRSKPAIRLLQQSRQHALAQEQKMRRERDDALAQIQKLTAQLVSQEERDAEVRDLRRRLYRSEKARAALETHAAQQQREIEYMSREAMTRAGTAVRPPRTESGEVAP